MQKRTSRLKFGDLAEKSGLNLVSNLSTKAEAAKKEKLVRALVERFDTELNPDS